MRGRIFIRLNTQLIHILAACGFTGLAAGYAIGIVGDAVSAGPRSRVVPSDTHHAFSPRQCVRAYLYESRVFVTMVLILIFA